MRHFGGRYLALTIRARPADVRICHVYGLYAHYPVSDRGRFRCADDRLNQVWTISRNTMLACMEDNGHKRVTHNNTFLVDSLRIGARMADIAEDAETAKRYRALADKLADNINKHLWDETRGAYIDSIHDDGSKSTSISRQINTLALLHRVVPETRCERVKRVAFTDGAEDVVRDLFEACPASVYGQRTH